MTSKGIRRLQAFSSAIRWTFVPHFTRFKWQRARAVPQRQLGFLSCFRPWSWLRHIIFWRWFGLLSKFFDLLGICESRQQRLSHANSLQLAWRQRCSLHQTTLTSCWVLEAPLLFCLLDSRPHREVAFRDVARNLIWVGGLILTSARSEC